MLLQIIVQGRGGQGAQMAGDILANVFFREGKYVQAFATYGGARRGTLVSSFIRVDDRPIRLRCGIERPDVIVCFDPSLLNADLLSGATENTLVVINSPKAPEYYEHLGEFKVVTVDAKTVAKANQLGRIMNTAVVGAVAGVMGQPGLEVLREVVAEMSPVKVDQNVQACMDGYMITKKGGC